jgi:hypothetical protein
MIGLLMLANSKDADFSHTLNKFLSQDVIPQIYGKWIGQDKKLMCLNIIAHWEQTMFKKD